MLSLALTLILVASEGVQPVIGPEVVSGPIRPTAMPNASTPLALAGDGGDLAVAWSEGAADGVNRVYAARVDAAGRIEAVQAMPAGPGNAGLPVLAATATGFEIGWIEQSSNTTKGVVCALDRQLVPMGRPSSLGTGGARVVLASSGIRVVAGYNGTLFDLAVDGTVVTTSPGLVSAESLVISPSRAIEAGQSVVESTFYCSPLSWYIFGCPNGMTPGMTAPVYNTSSMSLLDAGSGQITEYFNFPSNLGGAVDFDGESVLLVRYDGLPGYGGSVSGIRISPDAYGSKHFPPPSFALGTFPSQMRDSDAVPAIAHDGRQHLVVWQNGKAISGALINAGGRVTTLSIAQNGSLPNVIATAPGRFLVTYDLIDAAGRHLATRFIDVTSRRRAAS